MSAYAKVYACEKGEACSREDIVEVVALDLLEMEGHGYDRFGDGERDNYQIDYRRIVGDMEPARPRVSNREGEQPHTFGAYAHPTPHGHGHETAAQRYSATRIQAGYEPERSVPSSRSVTHCTSLTLAPACRGPGEVGCFHSLESSAVHFHKSIWRLPGQPTKSS